MIVTDQENIRLLDQFGELGGGQNGFVGPERFAEIKQVLAAAIVVAGADFALDPGDRM
jgi:hypothetical protein